jgi:hypothetical protein
MRFGGLALLIVKTKERALSLITLTHYGNQCVIEMMEGFIDMWQVGYFTHDINGWRVWYAAGAHALTKPFVDTDFKLMVHAKFKNKLRTGQYCAHPDKLIDFVNSYERKDK